MPSSLAEILRRPSGFRTDSRVTNVASGGYGYGGRGVGNIVRSLSTALDLAAIHPGSTVIIAPGEYNVDKLPPFINIIGMGEVALLNQTGGPINVIPRPNEIPPNRSQFENLKFKSPLNIDLTGLTTPAGANVLNKGIVIDIFANVKLRPQDQASFDDARFSPGPVSTFSGGTQRFLRPVFPNGADVDLEKFAGFGKFLLQDGDYDNKFRLGPTGGGAGMIVNFLGFVTGPLSEVDNSFGALWFVEGPFATSSSKPVTFNAPGAFAGGGSF